VEQREKKMGRVEFTVIYRLRLKCRSSNDLVFLLRSDKQAEYGKVAMLNELKLAGVKRAVIATERKANP
jgi:biopolymer transport protein ExbD